MAAKKKPVKKASRGGRPPLPEAERRSTWVRLRVTPTEKAAIAARAAAEGMTITEWIVSRAT